MPKQIIDCQPAIDWLCQKYLDGHTQADHILPSVQESNQGRNGNARVDAELKTNGNKTTDADFEAAYKEFALLPSPDQEKRIDDALDRIPADDREIWILVGHALKNIGLPLEKWDKWSSKSVEYKPGECKAKWNGFLKKEDKAKQVGIGTIIALAKTYDPAFLKNYKRTDDGNAQRFADQYGHKVRWYEAEKAWLHYDGQRWVIDDKKQVLEYARQVARSIFDEAIQCGNEDERKRFINFAVQSASANRIEAMLRLAKSELCVTPEMLDSDPNKFNITSGTINVKTGELLKHSATDYITQLSDVVYDPQAQAPVFMRFLNTIFDGSKQIIEYMKRKNGSSLSGEIREHELTVDYGSGQNGKTTFAEIIMDCLGSYAQVAPANLLAIKPRSDAANEDVARLRGKRFVVISETDESMRLNEGLAKTLTGGDKISARFLYGHIFEFQPQCKICIFTNHKPRITSQSKAIWRRVRLVPFTVTIPENVKDPLLLDKLRKEKSGILNWLLSGCLAWMKEGLSEPPEIVEATNAYKSEEDRLENFIQEYCRVASGAQVGASILFTRYKNWCIQNHEPELTSSTFKNRMGEKGHMHKKTNKGNFWLGVSLLDETEVDFNQTAAKTKESDEALKGL